MLTPDIMKYLISTYNGGDKINVFKITHDIYDPDVSLKLAYHSDSDY